MGVRVRASVRVRVRAHHDEVLAVDEGAEVAPLLVGVRVRVRVRVGSVLGLQLGLGLA